MKPSEYFRAFTRLGLVLIAWACSPVGIRVSEPWARSAEAESNSAVYLTLENHGSKDALVGAASDVADEVLLHRTLIDSEGVARMEPQPSITLNRNDSLTFEPGGYHIMLVELYRPLGEGQSIQVTLEFKNAGEITVDVPIRSR